MSEQRSKVHDIVERHLAGFDPDLTFKENCLDSMITAAIMVDIEIELGVELMSMAEDPKQRIPETLQELEVVVLEKMMARGVV